MLNRMMKSNDNKGMWKALESSENIHLKHFLAFDLDDRALRRVQHRRDHEPIVEVVEFPESGAAVPAPISLGTLQVPELGKLLYI